MISMTKTVLVLLALIASAYSLTTVSSFKELAQAHCRLHPLETLHRLASGQLAAAYGPAFADIDCYIRQFVNKGTPPSTQTARTISKKKRTARQTRRKPKNCRKLTRWWRNTLQGWTAYRRAQTAWRQCTRCGVFTVSCCTTTTAYSGSVRR
jgi:hypothetical protein